MRALAFSDNAMRHPHRITHHPIPVANFGLSDSVEECPQIWFIAILQAKFGCQDRFFVAWHHRDPILHLLDLSDKNPWDFSHIQRKIRGISHPRRGPGDDALLHLFCGAQIPGHSPLERPLAAGLGVASHGLVMAIAYDEL